MALDLPAAAQALWALYDAGGPRPEYALPVLWSESNLNPSVQNSLGYSGINQASTALLQGYGISPADYVTWPASQQITRVVTPFWLGIVKQYGPINSGTRLYQANFLPATMGQKALDTVLASRDNDPHGWYAANSGLDWQHTGAIRISDLAHSIAKSAGQVQAQIAAVYSYRPGATPEDPVYGTDYLGAGTWETALRIGAIFALSGGLALAAYDGLFDRWIDGLGRWWRRA